MNVKQLIDRLQLVENKDLSVFAVVGEYCLQLNDVQVYEDAVELWSRTNV